MTANETVYSNMEEITKHIEQYVGHVHGVFQDPNPKVVPIYVQHVLPTKDKPWHTLVTSGMSDLPMTIPLGIESPKYTELMMCLPSNWKMDQESLKDRQWYWPIAWLRYLAQYPHVYNTGFGYGHSIPNNNPPEPFASNTELCASIFTKPVLVSREFWKLNTKNDKTVVIYCVVPIYQEELDLKLEKGMEELENRLDDCEIYDIVILDRKNVGLI